MHMLKEYLYNKDLSANKVNPHKHVIYTRFCSLYNKGRDLSVYRDKKQMQDHLASEYERYKKLKDQQFNELALKGKT